MPKQQRKKEFSLCFFVYLFFSMCLVECREGSLKRDAIPMEKIYIHAKFMS